MTSGPTPSSLSEPLLEMEEVVIRTHSYPNHSMVQVSEWCVHPGDVWIIAGMVGSGKSDLLATAAGVFPPQTGTVRLFGQLWSQTTAEAQIGERLRLGLVHDGGLMLRHLTVAENIALPLQYHNDLTLEEASERTMAWLKLAEMEPMANTRASGIGRSWGQRAGLARACMLMPELLLLDNPLTGLDSQHSRWWLQTLQQLAAGHPLQRHRPTTLVVTCDDFRPWLKLGTRFAVLREGVFTELNRHEAEHDFGLSTLHSDR